MPAVKRDVRRPLTYDQKMVARGRRAALIVLASLMLGLFVTALVLLALAPAA